MTIERRPQLAQRRRRVLYSHQCEDAQIQAKGRRAESLREARRPATAYGSRVYRRLRARWFGIVPVRRRTMMLVTSVLGAMVLLLMAAHAAALGWPPLAYRMEIARPFRLNRPDSFGNWLGTLLLASGAIISLMIYQLRRHRTNDYRGHYRLWRPAIIILAIASIDSSMRLSDWLGHVFDEALGERKALAGGDWIRLLLVIGGATFGMRLIAEVRRSKLATASLASAACMLVLPTLARWNIVKFGSLSGTTLLAAAPLVGSALLWIGLVSYLRMLYRDVRNLDAGDRIADRLQHIRQRLRAATRRNPRPEGGSEAVLKSAPKATAPRPAKQNGNADEAEEDSAASSRSTSSRSRGSSPSRQADQKNKEDDGEEVSKPLKRRWFGLRGSERTAQAHEETSEGEGEQDAKASKRHWFGLRSSARATPVDEETSEGESEHGDKPGKRRWLGLRASNRAAPEEGANEETAREEPPSRSDEENPRVKRRWLPKLSLRLRPRTVDEEFTASDDDPPKSSVSKNAAATERANGDQDETDEEEYIDPESIEWDSLSKAERRRLKRQLKRQDRAA